jgi:peptidoglycan/LPS O-acetylase OafA/YrhL
VNTFIPIEVARGFLATWVVVSHVWAINEQQQTLLLDGSVAVSVFFALSGFLMAFVLGSTQWDYRRFLVRRFFRLFPVYVVCVSISAALVGYGLMPRNFDAGTEGYHALLHATMLHGLVPDGWLRNSAGAFLTPAWTLSVEWQFYLLIPIFFIAYRRCPNAATIVLVVTGFSARLFSLFGIDLPWASLATHMPMFLLGIFSFVLYDWMVAHQSALPTSTAQALWLIPIFPLLFLSLRQSIAIIVWLCIFAAVVADQLTQKDRDSSRIRRWLFCRPLRGLGAISYSLYLVHEPVIWVCSRMFGKNFHQADGIWSLVSSLAVIMPASVGLAWLLFVFVEQPAIAYGRKRELRL